MKRRIVSVSNSESELTFSEVRSLSSHPLSGLLYAEVKALSAANKSDEELLKVRNENRASFGLPPVKSLSDK